jgi:tetratricopeptide (TPR) repeat protein
VTRQRNEYELSAANQPLITKVQLALGKGLGKRALDLLLEADPAQIAEAEAGLQLRLLLYTGRAHEVQDRIGEELKPVLGFDYEWDTILMDAALGNYAEAGAYLDQLIAGLEKANLESMLVQLRSQIFPFQRTLPGYLGGINNTVERVRQLADYRVLRGLLALEEGDIAQAERAFQRALDMGKDEPFAFESRPIAVRYLQLIHDARRSAR